MKLLIQENLSATYFSELNITPEDMEQDAEFWKYVTYLLDSYSMHYTLEYVSDYWWFEVPVQKVVLDELCMNTLFHEVLFLLDYELKYAGLGGKGCGFSLCLYQK